MLFNSVEDFYAKVQENVRLSRDEEIYYARKMSEGDSDARKSLIDSYLPFVAGYLKRQPKDFQTLDALCRCVSCLEKGVDSFNFLQDSETFIHYLSMRLRQCVVKSFAGR